MRERCMEKWLDVHHSMPIALTTGLLWIRFSGASLLCVLSFRQPSTTSVSYRSPSRVTTL